MKWKCVNGYVGTKGGHCAGGGAVHRDQQRTTYKFPCTLLKEAAGFACPDAPGPAPSRLPFRDQHANRDVLHQCPVRQHAWYPYSRDVPQGSGLSCTQGAQ
jgi:hypothetical protein